MQDSNDQLCEEVENDARIKELHQKVIDYKAQEAVRIAEVRKEIAGLQKQMQSLRAKVTRKRNLLRIKRAPIRVIERRMRTRRNTIIRAHENKEQREYAKMFRVKKNKILRI